MRRIVGIVVVVAVLGAACGSDAGDTVDGAGTCAELALAWDDGDQTDQGFRDKIGTRLEELVSEQRALGDNAAAVACRLFLSGAGTDDSEEFFMEGDS